jgi:hypothetical protein
MGEAGVTYVGNKGQASYCGSIRIARRKWKDNIKMNVQEISWTSVHCLHVAQDKGDWRIFVNTVMNHRFHKIPIIS